MDSSFYLMSGGIALVFGLVIGGVAWSFFRRYKQLNRILNRAHEMTGKAAGQISEIVTVSRRNRSFRWKNEYPVVAYSAGGKQLATQLEWAEKRRGHYELGGNYNVCYVPSEPSCCVVEEFRKTMQRSRTQNLVWTVIFGVLTFNVVVSSIMQMIEALLG